MFVEVKDPEDKVSRALSPAESSALHLAPAQAGAAVPLLVSASAKLLRQLVVWEDSGFSLQAKRGLLLC